MSVRGGKYSNARLISHDAVDFAIVIASLDQPFSRADVIDTCGRIVPPTTLPWMISEGLLELAGPGKYRRTKFFDAWHDYYRSIHPEPVEINRIANISKELTELGEMRTLKRLPAEPFLASEVMGDTKRKILTTRLFSQLGLIERRKDKRLAYGGAPFWQRTPLADEVCKVVI
jgi:hypothetical protein